MTLEISSKSDNSGRWIGHALLPATKAMPPVVDEPAVQYVVEEAVDAGRSDILMNTVRNKRALEDYFDRAPAVERTLEH